MVAWWWLIVAFVGGIAMSLGLFKWAAGSFVPPNWR